MYFHYIIWLSLISSIVVIAKDLRIVGGVDADIRDLPYIAQFRLYKQEQFFCAGAIISHNHILTAAHCTDDVNKSDVRVYVGSSSSSNYSITYYNVHDIKVHPKYLLATEQHLKTRYDIAVVTVRPYIPFNAYQNKIELPTSDIEPGELGLISGWGWKTYPLGWISDNLQKLSMWIIPNEQCANHFKNMIFEEQICVYRNKEVGTCFGDSGGPLVNHGKLIGILSFTNPCALGDPDIYSRVYTFLEFINSVTSCSCLPLSCNCM